MVVGSNPTRPTIFLKIRSGYFSFSPQRLKNGYRLLVKGYQSVSTQKLSFISNNTICKIATCVKNLQAGFNGRLIHYDIDCIHELMNGTRYICDRLLVTTF